MKLSRFLTLLLCGCFLGLPGAFAEWLPMQSGADAITPVELTMEQTDSSGTSFTVEIPGIIRDVRREQSDVYQSITMEGAGLLTVPGNPELPVIRKFVAVPRGAEVSVSTKVLEETVLEDTLIWPSQPQYKRGDPKPSFTLNQAVYQSNDLYPAELARIVTDGVMRDFRVVMVEIAPVQYNPAAGQLRIATRVEVTIRTEGGINFVSSEVFPSFQRVYQKNILNFEATRSESRDAPEPMLIIADDDFINALDSFVEWKTKRGLDVTLVGTSETGTSSSAVQAYIQQAYNTWNPKPVYVLLVGDAPQIEPLTGIGSCASDYMFTLLEGGDYIPDVFISRLSAQNLGELEPQLDKIMHYETAPLVGSWLDSITGISSSLSGSAGINDDERVGITLERFAAINPNVSADQLYSSNGQGTTTNIAASVNEGRFWICYCGHGSGTSWSGPYFEISDVDALTNGYKTPFIMDVSCDNGGFQNSSDCFAESWMKGGTVGDAHGAVGMYSSSTSTSWDPPAIMAGGVCFSVCGNESGTIPGGDYKMGEMSYNGMLYLVSEIGTGDEADEVMQQYVLFGDCSTFMRSDELIEPVVTHAPSAPVAPYPYEVNVADAKGPIADATVCLYKPGDVHAVAMTNASGVAVLNISPTMVGDMILTVIGQNLTPYESLITVAPAGCGIVMMDKTKYNCDDIITVNVYDSDLNLNPGAVDTAQADIMSDSESSPEILTLMETGPDTSVFTTTIMTSDTQSGTGYLLLAHDDTITAHYHDYDCNGGEVDVTDEAIGDCQGPEITNLMISDIGTNSVLITWTTNEDSDTVVYYGEAVPPTMTYTDTDMTTDHEVILDTLEVCTEYFLKVSSTDSGGNVAEDDNGGNYYNFTTLQIVMFLEANMDTDPGWTYEGDWAWGQPTGTAGDPSAGYTGNNVVGYNLNGAYPNNLPATYATTPSFDCSMSSDVYLSYWVWLGVESASYDHATLEISTDGGSAWTVIWSHEGETVNPTDWSYSEYDISSWAAGNADVKLRWGMGPSDSVVNYCGWNIDDVMVSFTTPCNVPLLNHESHSIDDSMGNNDGEINAGETISMDVTLVNNGLDATGVTATLSTTNPHVTITTDTAAYPNIAQSSSGTSLTSYQFSVSPEADDGEMINFQLAWFSSESSGSTNFPEMIVAPELVFGSMTINDSTGDNDGILDPGESAQLIIQINNIGTGMASDVIATLSSNLPAYIAIDDAEAEFPNIPSGGMGTSIAPHFTITIDGMIPDPSEVRFTLDITAQGYTTDATFNTDVTSSTFARRYSWNMDTDPGWTTEGDWAWGQPTGTDGDPTAGYTGINVYGYNLTGAYANNLPETNLTTGPINCSDLQAVEVHFMRWLGMESSSYDHAAFKVSNDGTTWTTVWEHSGATFTDPDWQAMTYDISTVADNQVTVYLRWIMGTTDTSVTYCGWNLDDVEIWAESSGPIPSPTPVWTSTPINTPTPVTPTATPTPVTPTATATPFICLNNGDVNYDGDHSPADALMSFQMYMEVIPDPSDDELCRADCNGNTNVTPEDALCIFMDYLSGNCDCTDPMPTDRQDRTLVSNEINGDVILETEITRSNELILLVNIANHDNSVDAFGFRIMIPEGLTYQGTDAGELIENWEIFGANEQDSVLTVGGFDPVYAVDNSADGTLVSIRFAADSYSSLKSAARNLQIYDLKDDLKSYGISTGDTAFGLLSAIK